MNSLDYKSCIDACLRCAEVCDRCIEASSSEATAPKATHLGAHADCSQICRAAVGFMSRGSQFCPEICRFCAEVCDVCAAECEAYPQEHRQQCAQACHQCADECRRMIAIHAP